MVYKFFIDETGDHGLKNIDVGYPIFLLLGALFKDGDIAITTEKVKAFKVEFFKSDSIILHSNDIRRCDEAFQILFDLNVKERFYEGLNKILQESEFKVIAAAIDKIKHIKQYGKVADDPYSMSLSFILERLVLELEGKSSDAVVDIVIEKRGKKEDAILLSHYNSVIDSGTTYINSEKFKSRIKSFSFSDKRENVIGLQIADLCAYPLARNILDSSVTHLPYEIVKGKIRRGGKMGRIEGYGLKKFP